MQDQDGLSVYLIRHGETIWNRELRFQGHGDSPLTEKGRAQAEALGRRMQAVDFDELYASDLGRARETAAVIAAFSGHEVRSDERLRERNYGMLEGLAASDINIRFPEILSFLRSDPEYIIPEGESHRQAYERNIGFLDDLALSKPGRKITVVAHGGLLDSCFRYVCGMDLKRPRCFATPNAGLSAIVMGVHRGHRQWIIDSWGDVTHLEHVDHTS